MTTKSYDKAFKEKAVRLSYERRNVSNVARELGVSCNSLRDWRKKFEVNTDGPFEIQQFEKNDTEVGVIAAFWLWKFLLW